MASNVEPLFTTEMELVEDSAVYAEIVNLVQLQVTKMEQLASGLDVDVEPWLSFRGAREVGLRDGVVSRPGDNIVSDSVVDLRSG